MTSGNAGTHVCQATGFAEMQTGDVEQSLVSRFAQQVGSHRDCVALRDPDLSLTYGELDGWANAIAVEILDRGSGGAPVAILLPQSVRSVAAILGALKAGSPYVSLEREDPRSPELAERVGARVVVTDRRTATGRHPTLIIGEPEDGSAPGAATMPDDTAYVFFTSGSTGRPKGVYDSHRNVLHNVLRYTNTLRISPTDRLSLLQSPAFSGTVSTLFAGLLTGACVLPFSLQQHGIAALGRWLLDQGVTVYHSVPAILRSLLEVEPGPYTDVRLVRLEGDRATSLDVDLHRRHFRRDSVLVNGLGLTETGLVRQLFVDRDVVIGRGALAVGYPVPGVEVTIVDAAGLEAPAGAVGEIAVRSDYLALGYWEEPGLTDESFRRSGSQRTYLTGDLGRLGEDDCLEYLGRKDGTLKVLGNRVEPAEVEAELLRLTGVTNAAVTTEEGRRGEGVLVAHVAIEPGAIRAGEVRDALRERLPAYVVPSRVELHEALPVAASGKVDRQALATEHVRSAGAQPVTSHERLVAGIWERILDTRPVGRDDDFFVLGGDSLALAEMVAQVEAKTGSIVPPSVLAGIPTVRAVAAGLRHPSADDSSLTVLLETGAGAPLVLVHGNTGDVLHYSTLLRSIEWDRRVWALEHPAPTGVSLSELARRHAVALLDANPTGPHLLAGFCFGGVVAHETANALVAHGAEVGLLALLGITPFEYPAVPTPLARRAWGRLHPQPSSLPDRLRWHAGDIWRRPARERPGHVARGAGRIAGRLRSRLSGRRDRTSAAAAFQRLLAGHEPHRFPGRALLVLHEDDTADYTDDARREWAPLAEEVEVVLLPGRDHAMLSAGGVHRLASLLNERMNGVRV